MKMSQEKKGTTRREFLGNLAKGAGFIALAGLSGCTEDPKLYSIYPGDIEVVKKSTTLATLFHFEHQN